MSVVIAAGGTGGHLTPGLAVAEALGLHPGVRVSFVGTARGLEGDLVRSAGYPLHLVDVIPWARTIGARRFLAPLALLRATRQAGRVLRAERAAVALGMGGYAGLPVVAAARLARVPSLIHEQNAIPGLANRIGARLTRHIALTFGEAAPHFPSSARTRVVGLPLRRAIATFDREALRAEALDAFGLHADRPVILVFGGSQGAARLNAAAAGLAERWRDRSDRQMLVVAGRAHADELRAALRAAAGDLVVRCEAFVERMELAYAAADVALCRAGAATISELAAAGVPAILVPYPYARNAHQEANARALERAGAAATVADGDATAERLELLLSELLSDPGRRAQMAKAALDAARRTAAEDIAAWLLELAGVRGG